ncbi:hypothetical protein DICPUDRAFT_149116 [Dictyostelium purpureum]|uniref:Coiled-coil domain-containing protein 130 n=1 Tax=Dictyostelium purpureum TaxID=5786 RepID=F0ZCW2_DICPU|nr:uncharacterized protein DICPUDRAFT_149116 [Dictyostelium purpureum]EGC38231.1 hypothetical protein DICPUDRAFT_149116 [Dictyostelium purpureum]|eukprot:XP_003285269.1 hypothetical protein DICPUDRAFT_149116 [Dictyostelium purpureum]
MAERRATNKYYPPDWDPSKGSINTYRGQHHLRDRAKKLATEGILVIRFEMPYSVVCLGCQNYIGVGVRYNAEKKTVGKYFSTNILSFKMKCHLCDQYFVIETDPKNTDYKIISGLRKREIEHNDNENLIQLISEEESKKLNEDVLYKLEYRKNDQEKNKERASQLDQLKDFMDKRSVNDYQLSSMMRKNFREKKKEDTLEIERLKAKGINISLVKETQEDRDQAKKIEFNYNSLKRKLDENVKLNRELKLTEPILSKSSTTTTTTSTSTTGNNKNNSSNYILQKEKREGIIKKKSKVDPSLFKNNQPSNVNNVFSSNLFN